MKPIDEHAPDAGIDPVGRERRDFLKSATLTGLSAGLLASGPTVRAQGDAAEDSRKALAPSEAQRIREHEPPKGYTQDEAARYFVDQPGSDYMVDVLRSLDIDYFVINPGDTFRGLQESVVNYGGNKKPEVITCLHEEQAAALAHGYAKVAGKPLVVGCHGTVGLQHMAMAVYNAWADRVPILIIGGNHLELTDRSNFVGWIHTAQDPARVIRDFTKWDDQPVSLPHFGESVVRSFQLATTPPMAPVAIIADARLQEQAMKARPEVPRFSRTVPPQASRDILREVARRLVAAQSPVIMADRYARSQEGVALLIELAELLQTPVIDRGSRMNFPSTHYLNHTFRQRELVAAADVILGLELADPWGVIHHIREGVQATAVRHAPESIFMIDLGSDHLYLKSNYQDFQRYFPSDLSIAGDAQASLPALIDAVREETSGRRGRMIGDREQGHRRTWRAMREQWAEEARYAWSASPISTARLCMELWDLLEGKDWALTSPTLFQSMWPNKLWDIDKHYQFIGHSGGFGLGYGCPASVGAALAHREHGRLPVSLQSDGDLMYTPGSLWTAAHHRIPLLSVVHNNGGYHQEFMEVQTVALQRQRGIEKKSWRVGNEIDNPLIDYTRLATSLGVWATGPISSPADLRPALAKAIEVVEAGEPALVDVISQPR